MLTLKKPLVWMLMIGLFTAVFTSCDDDDPEMVNEEELITTLKLLFEPDGGGQNVEISFVDLDGDGGNAPVITGGTLAANTDYSVSITLLNESESPAENITEEVEEEDDEHQFFFLISAGLNLSYTYEDADDDGNPIGLSTTFSTGDASAGTLTVILRHEPDKFATGVSDGDLTNAGGETDIEVAFDVDIQ